MTDPITSGTTPLKVFISYSRGSDTHDTWILNLATDLINYGNIDVILDQFDLRIGNEMTYFMERSVTADKILVVLTPDYKLKADQRKGGVGFEYSLISKEYYDQEPDKTKIIPILREGDFNTSGTFYISTKMILDMRNNAKYNVTLFELIKTIKGLPLVQKPELKLSKNLDNLSAPDIEKTLFDFRKKEQIYNKKMSFLNSSEARILYKNEIDKIIDQISKSLENYKSNFGMYFIVKVNPSQNITFSTGNFTYFFGVDNYEYVPPATISMNFFSGVLGFDNYSLYAPPNVKYRKKYTFSIDENLSPIFINKDNDSDILTSDLLATFALREIVNSEIKQQEKELIENGRRSRL